ncbi:MAG: penicillin-binding transpeptidase domain-containing protein [Candidatus Colwellbacteria bacterium]|nr:penicillin-binding transpeptidase domain-containing protein [Candidatus Colwellbacteria bacterium]
MKHRAPNINFDEVISDSLSLSEFNLVELPLKRRVFIIFIFLALIIAGIFCVRVVAMAGFSGHDYLERAQGNIHQGIPLIAPRGTIIDRSGIPISKNQLVFAAFLDTGRMIRMGEDTAVLDAANSILGIDEIKMLDLIQSTGPESIADIILANDVTREQALAIESLGLKSLNIEESYKRDQSNPAYAHLIGYVGLVSGSDLRDNDDLVLNDYIGRMGLEMQYDDLLRGINGQVTIFRNSIGEIEEIRRTREPIQGEDLKTTIDAELQEFFYTRMVQALLSLGRTSGTGIAINPQNGEVLALFSLPSFDANHLSDYLDQDTLPLFNRAVSGVYNPGSTIKPLHAAAALQEGVVSPETQIYSAGYIEIPNPYNPSAASRFVDWKAHGWVDVHSALARSSNVYFYVVGGGFQEQIGLGIERLNKYWRKFGLDEITGIDIPGEAVGFLPAPDEKEERTGSIWRIGDTYNVSIGQGDLAITPLRLITAVSAIANDGVAYVPHVRAVSEKEVLLDISDMASALTDVRRGMLDAVAKDYGTANMLNTIPMVIGAKTGSAQVADKTKTNALITAYASRDANTPPEIAILILVEDAREGSLNTVPVAKDVLQWYYDNRVNTQFDEENEEKE